MNTFFKIVGIMMMFYGAFTHNTHSLALGGIVLLEARINSLSNRVDELKH
ncbi:hypothetical protein [Bacillus wiedmannii]|nr:hypothetical protein [Bacillus wiedmannii]